MKKNNKGFTLVELIIVVAIIVVLAAVLAPQYTKYVERTRESNDLQVATSIMDATLAVVADPQNEVPSKGVIRVAWLKGGNIEVGSAHDSGLRGVKHSNGLDLSEHIENEIYEVVAFNNGVEHAQSSAGKSQHFVFRVDVDTGKVEVAGTNSSPADNNWNLGSGLWVTQIGVSAPLSDEFYFHY